MRRVGINTAILESSDLAKLLRGFDRTITTSIEMPIRMWQLSNLSKDALNNFRLENLSNLLYQTEIFPLSILADESQFIEQYEQIEQKLEICNALNCRSVSLTIDPWSMLNKPKDLFVKRVRALAQAAQPIGITLNLEYISHIIAKNNGDHNPYLFCSSLEDAVDLIKDIDCQNVKLLLDFIHWYCDNSRVSIPSIADIIGFVHVCDHQEKEADKISDFNRVLPFEGDLPLLEFLEQIAYCKKDIFIGVEVFRSNAYAPSLENIRKSINKINKVLDKNVSAKKGMSTLCL